MFFNQVPQSKYKVNMILQTSFFTSIRMQILNVLNKFNISICFLEIKINIEFYF